jgi:hypothetical protein
VALVKPKVSGEYSASIVRMIRIGELGRTLAVSSNLYKLRRITRATRRNIPEDDILHSHRRENLKCALLDNKNPVRTSQETHYVCYKVKPVNYM